MMETVLEATARLRKSGFVVDFAATEDGQLRCGECEVYREVTVTNKVAERFDIELDRRADLIHRALNKLDRERMTQQVETMIGALRHGLIEPSDFARTA